MSVVQYNRHREVRDAVAARVIDFCNHWQENADKPEFDEWELEVRLGQLSRHAPPPPGIVNEQCYHRVVDKGVRFEARVAAVMFLRLFDRLAHTALAMGHTITTSVFTSIERESGGRVVHNEMHAGCYEHVKHALEDHIDFERDIKQYGAWAFDFRVASSVETTPVSVDCNTRNVCDDMVRRKRRRIILSSARLWGIDFTRLNDCDDHQIELELRWPAAYTETLRVYNALADKPYAFIDFLAHRVTEQLLTALEILNNTCR